MLSALLAYSSKTAVFAENKALLRDAARAVLEQKNVLAVEVLTTDRKVLVSEKKKILRGRGPELAVSGTGGELAELSEGKDSINIVTPVTIMEYNNPTELFYFEDVSPGSKKRVVGFVRIFMDKRALGSETSSILIRSAVIAVVFILLGAVIIVLAIRRATRPLMRLTEAVTALGKGESIGKVPVETSDEVGRLAEAFNTMSDNLEAREEEKRSLEEKLRLARTMEAIGTLARGIAHDFNNILSTVQGSVYILEKKLYENSPLRDYTGRINVSLTRARSLIQSLLIFSRTQTISLYPTDINAVIRKMRPLLTGILGEDIRLDLSLTEGELVIKADPVQMEQVIMNLCTNARDAMPDGGRVTIETAPAFIDEEGDADERVAGNWSHVCVMISDNGTGMDEETREHVFEPFFTTKTSGKVNGLGLSIVYGIVEQHGGRIDVSTKPGEGTEFRIYLPLAEKRPVENT